MRDNELVGVSICGRPVNRYLDDGLTVEVTRLCVKENVKNGCSMLYSSSARIAKEMGYTTIITYILDTESGISLKASGWISDHLTKGGEWKPYLDRERNNIHPLNAKQCWMKRLGD
jgi:hypothetical protein